MSACLQISYYCNYVFIVNPLWYNLYHGVILVKKRLLQIYNRLYSEFGPQNWWPADSSIEVIIGAILTQSTSWKNVEKAVQNMKKKGLMTPEALYKAEEQSLAEIIRPSGYYNMKAKKLKAFVNFLFNRFSGDLDEMFKTPTALLRKELLSIYGIGEETADSILLYAGNLPVFVVDAYTRRIFSRLGFFGEETTYAQIQRLFMDNLPPDPYLFNEYHALIVALGKDYCRKTKPNCSGCPLRSGNLF